MSWIELVAQRRPPTAPPGMQPPENGKDWFRIENSVDEEDTTDIYVYESIGGWFGMWADDFIRELKSVSTSKINLRLNSPGGSVFDGIAIANSIRSHPANVTVYVDSLAASIASVIALAGDRVVMMPQSQFMVHNASGGAYGDSAEMTKMADLLDKQSRNIAEAYAQHTGGTLAEWQDYMAAETWFTAEEAVAVGLADEVMPMKPAKEEEAAPAASALSSVMNRTWDLSMYRYAGRDAAPAPTAYANGGIVNKATEDGTETVEPVKDEVIVNLGTGLSVEALKDLIREAVRAEFPPPDEEDPEDAATPPDEEEPQPEDAATGAPDEDAAPEDAKKKLPPFLQPDEDEDEDAEDAADEEPEANASPPDEEPVAPELGNEADAWLSIVDRLTTPSPSADDVFMSLKEAW